MDTNVFTETKVVLSPQGKSACYHACFVALAKDRQRVPSRTGLLVGFPRITAIKHFRAITGLGLAESKDAIDSYVEDNGWPEV